MSTRILRAVPEKKPDHEAVAKHWREAVGQYVKAKRLKSGKSQAAVLGPARRMTVAQIEKGIANVQFDILIEVIAKVGGDPSEAFRTKVPREFHGRHRDLFDFLVELVETGNEKALEMARLSLEVLHEKYVQRR